MLSKQKKTSKQQCCMILAGKLTGRRPCGPPSPWTIPRRHRELPVGSWKTRRTGATNIQPAGTAAGNRQTPRRARRGGLSLAEGALKTRAPQERDWDCASLSLRPTRPCLQSGLVRTRPQPQPLSHPRSSEPGGIHPTTSGHAQNPNPGSQPPHRSCDGVHRTVYSWETGEYFPTHSLFPPTHPINYTQKSITKDTTVLLFPSQAYLFGFCSYYIFPSIFFSFFLATLTDLWRAKPPTKLISQHPWQNSFQVWFIFNCLRGLFF